MAPRLPVPLAAGLYGVLLGLGFTTFILTFAVWALAGVSVALGDPALGLAIGLAFGAGRALPVVALAPRRAAGAAARRDGRAPADPALAARGRRRSRWPRARSRWSPDRARPRQARRRYASDPSVDGALLAWHAAGRAGRARAATARDARCPARTRRSAAAGCAVTDRRRRSRCSATSGDGFARSIPAPGADAVAVSDALGRLARARAATADAHLRRAARRGGEPRPCRRARRSSGARRSQGGRLLFHVAGRTAAAS